MRGGEAVQSAAGEGMTRGQYLPGGAAQQDVKGQPSALVTAPVTSAAQAACATATENPRSGEACPSRQTAAGSEGIEKMVNLTKHLNLLGMRVEDRVTGFKGVVATVGFDLYGCIQAVVNPGTDADGKLREKVTSFPLFFGLPSTK